MSHQNIADLLEPRTQSRSKDVSTFTKYEKGLITIEQAIKEFKSNNKINKSVNIDKEEFKEFMESLGYKQII